MSRTGRWLFSFLLCALPAWAEFGFSQFANKTTVGMDEPFELNIVISNPPPNARIEFPSSEDFEVLGRSSSTQFQYGTGQKPQNEQRYVLVLRAKKEGPLLIPAALLKTGNQTHTTKTLTLNVVRGQAPPSLSPLGNALGNLPSIPRADSDLFLQITLDKPSVYVGEQVLLSLLLYSRIAHAPIQSLSMPTFKGFFSEDLELGRTLPAEQKSVDGVLYHVTTLRKQALFAIQPGTFTFEPAKASFLIADFGMRPFLRGREVRRESNALTLEVKALPDAAQNLPVGSWTLELKAPSGPFTVGEPVELGLRLQGTGNIRNVPPLELLFPDSFKTFQPTVQNHTQMVGKQLWGSRTVQHIVIPQEAGNFTVLPVKFDYFHVETQQAASIQTPPLTWVVLPADAKSPPGSALTHAPPSLPAGALEHENLRPIHHRALFVPPSSAFVQKNTYWIWVALPLSLRFLGSLLQLALSQRGSSAKAQQRRREKAAARALRTCVGELKKNPCAASFSQLGKKTMAFLECKLGLSAQGLRREQLHAAMQARGLLEPLCQQVLWLLAECDAVQFGHAPSHLLCADRVCEAALYILKEWP